MSDCIFRFGLIFVLLTVDGSCDEGESGSRRFLSQRLQFGVELPDCFDGFGFGDDSEFAVLGGEVIPPVDPDDLLAADSVPDWAESP
jgi:hypothetical protein